MTARKLAIACIAAFLGCSEADSRAEAPNETQEGVLTATARACPELPCRELSIPATYPEFGRPIQAASSRQPCLCWPTGSQCLTNDRVHNKLSVLDEELICPTGEVCDGDAEVASGRRPHGLCRRSCYHPQADRKSELGCHTDEYCKLHTLRVTEDELLRVGLCTERNHPPTVQTVCDPLGEDWKERFTCRQ